VSLQGGPVEELARFEWGSLEIGTFDAEHVYLYRWEDERRTLLRIAH